MSRYDDTDNPPLTDKNDKRYKIDLSTGVFTLLIKVITVKGTHEFLM